ncbi:MAG: GntR family transcriptional regulator [Ignavibacteria bacterium RBG_13_36_8]|nr:MAG: GntR family transcriptional regulator [Ignavibacteria bacterium RBG_13_36_8]
MIEFKLDPKSGVPFYKQIIDQIRFGIASGNLKVGEQLPTVRALAVQLKVNLNTVNKSYKELEIQKVLETQQGTGTFIGNSPVVIDSKERQGKLLSICSEFLSIASSYGFTIEEVIQELKNMQGGSQ